MQAFAQVGGQAGPLGAMTSDPTTLIDGAYVQFEHGRIYWKAGQGALVVKGGIGDAYVAQGGHKSALGLPTGKETVVGDSWYQDFQGGRMYWNTNTHGHAVSGNMLKTYLADQASEGHLGLPTSDVSIVGGAAVQNFQKGIITTAGATTRAVWGGIGAVYSAQGGPTGGYGLPTGNEINLNVENWYQDFQGGRIYWSASTHGHGIKGGIKDTYQAMGGHYSYLGIPSGDEMILNGENWYQDFQGGRVYWSGSTLGHAIKGGIKDTYQAMGGHYSYLGIPSGDEMILNGENWYQDFQGGRVYWSYNTGGHAIKGGIKDTYQAMGGHYSYLGIPSGDETQVGNAWYQDLQGGRIYWSFDTHGHAVHGAIKDAYFERGASAGALGLPLSEEWPDGPNNVTQTFQNGTIAWINNSQIIVTMNSANRPAAGDEWGYISWVAGFAQEEDRRYGVPASVAIAQSIIESGWGQSSLTLVDNNYFGIKCPAYGSPFVSGCTSYSTTEYYNGQYVTIQDGFRSYNSPQDSFLDHGFFLSLGDPNNTANRYYPAFHTGSSQDFIRAVAAAGYATDPTYANKIISVMDRYNLYQYDV